MGTQISVVLGLPRCLTLWVLIHVSDQGDKAPPSSILELKLILAGRVLDNAVTLAEARTPAAGELVTMHIVVSPKVRFSAASIRTSEILLHKI